MTYFFHKGKIHVVLNKLEKLTVSEYNAEGTAEMVVRTLMETLKPTQTHDYIVSVEIYTLYYLHYCAMFSSIFHLFYPAFRTTKIFFILHA